MACLRKYANVADKVIGQCIISSVDPVSISKLKKTASRTSSTASVSVSITAVCALSCRAADGHKSSDIYSVSLETFIFVLFYFKVIFIVPLMGR